MCCWLSVCGQATTCHPLCPHSPKGQEVTHACNCDGPTLLKDTSHTGRETRKGACLYNNNNEYLERLTRTGPKRLHVLYKYILSKFNVYNMNAHTRTHTHRIAHARTRAHVHTRRNTHTHTHTHTPAHTLARSHAHTHTHTRTHARTHAQTHRVKRF